MNGYGNQSIRRYSDSLHYKQQIASQLGWIWWAEAAHSVSLSCIDFELYVFIVVRNKTQSRPLLGLAR